MRPYRKFFVLSLLASALCLALAGCGGDDVTTPSDKPSKPTVTTADVTAVTRTTAQCGGTIASDGGADVTVRGVCWGPTDTPTTADDATSDGTGTGTFTSDITGLSGGNSYYVRAYATNSAGTAYGAARPFSTPLADSTGTVTDIDGNVYLTVKIGDQWWMAENLKTTHYRNGEEIPIVTDNGAWAGLSHGGCCAYANVEANVDVYGRLYNWRAVNDARGIAPAGWHVPSDAEWQTLITTLGGEAFAGGKMKETGTEHWVPYNADATNESGFTALPGGARLSDGVFTDLGQSCEFWSTTSYDGSYAWFVSVTYAGATAMRSYNNKPMGYSVRCVKD